MSRTRNIVASAAVFAVAALLGAAVAFASGPSAGDNQYTDPLGGSSTPSTQSSSSPPASNPTPSPTSTPVATTSGATTVTSSSQPTATIAQGTARKLPYTGLDVWLAVAIGATLVAAGFGLRRALT